MGPFDNDTALDDLHGLALEAGLTWHEESDVYTGVPDASVVDQRLCQWLRRVTQDNHEAEATRAYAALGLLAMTLAGSDQLPLKIAGEERPFPYGESFAPLLDNPRAEALLPLASPALQAVFDPEGNFFDMWSDKEGLCEWRDALTRLLLSD